jgi:hypothetical protein
MHQNLIKIALDHLLYIHVILDNVPYLTQNQNLG